MAMKEWGWISDRPMLRVSKFKESRGRVRFLSDEERDRLLAVCRDSSSDFLYPALVLALSTGMRRGELLGHNTLQMVKRYAHLSEQHTAGVVASMNEEIFGIQIPRSTGG